MHATLHFARRASIAVVALTVVGILAGCDLATTPGTTGDGTPPPAMSAGDSLVYAGVTTAIDTTDLTATLTIDSDTGDELWASLAPGLGNAVNGERPYFRREITNSTRHYTVTTSGDTTTIQLAEDRTGVLRVRVDSVTTVERPFTDHGERAARAVWVAGFRPGHDSTAIGAHHDSVSTEGHHDSTGTSGGDHGRRTSSWKIVSSTVLNRWSTSVDAPVQILSVELTPENEPSVRIDDPSLLVSADHWPRFPSGRTTSVVVKIAGAAPGTQVVLHDRFEKNGRRIGLTPDTSDPTGTTFRGTWRPSISGDKERDWRRLLTVDVLDGLTMSSDSAAPYNSRQWVIPVAFHRTGRH